MATNARIDLLRADRPYYKANLHNHTTLSDGELTPEEIKQAYKAKGYQIVAYTDHNCYRYHQALQDADFLPIAASEVDIADTRLNPNGRGTTRTYHFNFFDLDPTRDVEKKLEALKPERRYQDMDYLNGFIKNLRSLGMLCSYNHPYWSMQDLTDYAPLEGLWAMEIYNHGCEYDGLYGYAPQAYDEMLRAGQRIHCLATDDNHNRFAFTSPYCDSFGGWVMVQADGLEMPRVMAALEKGDFYSSMGPQIHAMWLEGRSLHIQTSEVEQICVHNQGRGFHVVLAEDRKPLTDTVVELNAEDAYFHVEIKDHYGKFANTNTYYWDTLA